MGDESLAYWAHEVGRSGSARSRADQAFAGRFWCLRNDPTLAMRRSPRLPHGSATPQMSFFGTPLNSSTHGHTSLDTWGHSSCVLAAATSERSRPWIHCIQTVDWVPARATSGLGTGAIRSVQCMALCQLKPQNETWEATEVAFPLSHTKSNTPEKNSAKAGRVKCARQKVRSAGRQAVQP